MDNNCQIHKFNGILQNDEVQKFGEIVVVNPPSRNGQYIKTVDKQGDATIVGEGYFLVGGQQEKSVSLNNADFDYVSGNNSKVHINHKYDLVNLVFPSINLEDVRYCEQLSRLYSYLAFGNIEHVPASVKEIDITSDVITGNLNNLQISNVNYMRINSESVDLICNDFATFFSQIFKENAQGYYFFHLRHVTGTIEDIVLSLVNNGFSSGYTLFWIYDSSLTFGGSSTFSNDYKAGYLKWNGINNIVYQQGKDSDVSDTSVNVKMWVKGYSDQIELWMSQGNTVYIINS